MPGVTRKNAHIFIPLSAGVFLVLVILSLLAFNPQHRAPQPVQSPKPKTAVPDTTIAAADTLTVIGTGDIMMATGFPANSALPPDDGNLLFTPVDSILRSADITFGNLEGVLLDEGKPQKKCEDSTICYLFRQPTRYANILKKTGYNLLSIANNHMNDFGWAGIKSTIAVLDTLNIPCAGPNSKPSVIFKVKGRTIGFAAFSFNSGMQSINDTAEARKTIARLDSLCDIVIVSFHGGAEGGQSTRVSNKKEIFFDENRGNVKAFAHLAVDAGADIVFGHGPHVPRALDLYNNRIIAYSLGNFCTTTGLSLKGLCGIAPILLVQVDSKGQFLSGKIVSTKQKRLSGPLPDPKEQAFHVLKKLTALDSPEAKLVFSAGGSINPAPLAQSSPTGR